MHLLQIEQAYGTFVAYLLINSKVLQLSLTATGMEASRPVQSLKAPNFPWILPRQNFLKWIRPRSTPVTHSLGYALEVSGELRKHTQVHTPICPI